MYSRKGVKLLLTLIYLILYSSHNLHCLQELSVIVSVPRSPDNFLWQSGSLEIVLMVMLVGVDPVIKVVTMDQNSDGD